MKVDVLVAEIGSTTTVVNAFAGLGGPAPRFVGQGQAATTVLDAAGVTPGLQNAVDDLAAALGTSDLEWDEMLATSSAAGGLRMTVHGLVYDMTVRAAQEAALGAGANLHLVTAGPLTPHDLAEIERIAPTLVLLAGGTDYGERETALANAEQLAGLPVRPPVIYAGNTQNGPQIEAIFNAAGFECVVVENVYPRLDELNVEPTRRAIQQAFERHITEAPGMARVRELVTGAILPTPGAVMACARLLYDDIGDVLVLDVGGATTDVHSVTGGSEEIALISTAPQPLAKRTVEGDLGLYVSAPGLVRLAGEDALRRETGLDVPRLMEHWPPVPRTADELKLAQALCWHAASKALTRHAGHLRHVYAPTGRQTYAEGRDLTRVATLIGTGGALAVMPGGGEVLNRLNGLNENGRLLMPKPGAMRVLRDRHYILAGLGALAQRYPKAALALARQSLGIGAPADVL